MATGLKSRDNNRVLYLYGITREGEGAVPGITGVDAAATVEAVPCAGLVCWTSRVNKIEFAEDLGRNMENLEWLAEVSVRHQQAVAAIASSHDILPARFGTVFRSVASLAADVEKNKELLAHDLKRISGCEEWGVKIFGLQAQPRAAAGAKSGRDYLQAKAAALRAEAPRTSDPEVQRFVRALERVAVEAAAGAGAVSRGQRGLHWQGSLLVKRSQRGKLQQLMTRFSQDWEGERRIELSGPWPPYSFVSRSQEKEAGRA
jgi:Gas vesicle synthesis protein GvpL/GvpF